MGSGGTLFGVLFGSGTDPRGVDFVHSGLILGPPFLGFWGFWGPGGDPSPTPPQALPHPPSAPVVYIYCRTSPKSTQIRPPSALPLCLRDFWGTLWGVLFGGSGGTLWGGSGGPFLGVFLAMGRMRTMALKSAPESHKTPPRTFVESGPSPTCCPLWLLAFSVTDT